MTRLIKYCCSLRLRAPPDRRCLPYKSCPDAHAGVGYESCGRVCHSQLEWLRVAWVLKDDGRAYFDSCGQGWRFGGIYHSICFACWKEYRACHWKLPCVKGLSLAEHAAHTCVSWSRKCVGRERRGVLVVDHHCWLKCKNHDRFRYWRKLQA